ncbi:MAG TPA: hypothetical protein VIC05_01240 [Solirubrobacteraceae bacterium]|jgi:hypothetical protein
MPDPDPPVVFPHQILVDPTGHRRRRLTIVGRVVTTALGLWVVVLVLGGLGLQPLAGLPIVGRLGLREAAPPALPERVQAAVATHTTVPLATRTAQMPVGTTRVPSRRPTVTTPSRLKTRRPARTPARIPGHTKTTTGSAVTSPALAPSATTTSPSSTAPGHTKTATSPSTTTPGQTRTAPGQTKTGTGPPTTTPGGTPGANAKAHGAKGTVTTP